MDLERFVSVGVAVLCMSAIGVAATTYDSTVTQTPDDLIDFNNKQLPFGDASTKDVDQQIQRNKQSQGDADAPSNRESGRRQVQDRRKHGPEKKSQPKDGNGTPQVVNDPDRSGDDMTGSGGKQSLLDRLLELLKQLLPFLLALVLLALAYRYRERLLAVLLAPLALFESGSAAHERRERDPWESVDPSDEVDRAWYAMVRRADIDRPWARTPDECRAAAVDAGLDPDAVGTLTQLFREKRYSGTEPSDAHREGARRCLDQLDLGRRTV